MDLFCFQSLQVSVHPKSKNLQIVMKIAKNKDYLSLALINELEQLFQWIGQHLEINTVLLSPDGDHFGRGIDPEEWKNQTTPELNRFIKRVQQFVYSLFFLPQTVVMDLKSGATGISSELAIGADLRISYNNAILKFDHLQHGLFFKQKTAYEITV